LPREYLGKDSGGSSTCGSGGCAENAKLQKRVLSSPLLIVIALPGGGTRDPYIPQPMSFPTLGKWYQAMGAEVGIALRREVVAEELRGSRVGYTKYDI
jgi:hypothetical protein